MRLSSFAFIALTTAALVDQIVAFVGPYGASLPRGDRIRLEASRTKDIGKKKQAAKIVNKRNKSFIRKEPQPRPLLTDYDENRNSRINKLRLSETIGCEHFGTCPGCTVDKNVDAVDTVKSAKRFFSSTAIRTKRMDVHREDAVIESSDDGFFKVIVPSPVQRWRTQAKLAVAINSTTWARDGCKFGLYQRGTHNVLPIPNCEVHHPSINQAIRALSDATAKVLTPAYDEQSKEGGLRYVQCQVERSTGKVCLTLVWNAETLKETQPSLIRLVKEIQRSEPELWHSIWAHCNDSIRNNIFARNPNRWHRLAGPEFIREPIPVGDKGFLFFSPLCFRQGNMDGFDVLAVDVARHVPGGSRVCELYAGVGLLGLTALGYHADTDNPLKWVRCSDENPANIRSFTRAVDTLPVSITGRGGSNKKEQGVTLSDLIQVVESSEAVDDDDREKATYQVSSAAKALLDGQALGADTLIVDPPRRGLEPEVLQELCKPFNPNQDMVENRNLLTIPDHKVHWANDVQTLIYVSCGFDALARDTERLLGSRAGWMLESATGYILFPGSDHVETVCVFQRR